MSSVELVLVIVILGILGAIAAPRFFDNQAFSERAWFDEVASALRYAQKVAVASGCRVRVDLTAAAYSLTQQSSAAGHCNPADVTFPTAVRLADGTVMNGTAPAGVVLAPAIVVEFDALGRSNLGSDQSISVGPWTLLIEAGSGLVVTP